MRLCKPIIESSGRTWYHRDGFWGECRAAGRWLKDQDQVFHFLYGENLHRYLGVMKSIAKRQNRIVVSYHTPAWRMRELVRDVRHLRQLDAIVVMANCQKDYFAEVAPGIPVHFVPHAVDIDFFRPGTQADAPMKFVCVGSYLRGLRTFAAVAENFLRIDPKVEFHLVCNTEAAAKVPQLANLRRSSNVSDAELLQSYQSAAALLLPLEDAATNNAILGGMACGLPVISTDLPGMHDYTTEACRMISPYGNVEMMTEHVRMFVNGNVDRVAMGTASRQQAEALPRPKVRAMLQSLYISISR